MNRRQAIAGALAVGLLPLDAPLLHAFPVDPSGLAASPMYRTHDAICLYTVCVNNLLINQDSPAMQGPWAQQFREPLYEIAASTLTYLRNVEYVNDVSSYLTVIDSYVATVLTSLGQYSTEPGAALAGVRGALAPTVTLLDELKSKLDTLMSGLNDLKTKYPYVMEWLHKLADLENHAPTFRNGPAAPEVSNWWNLNSVFEAADMFDVNPAPFDNHTCLFIDANLTLLAAVPAQDAAVALSGIGATLASKVSTLSDFARSALSSARLATPDLSDSSLLVSSWNEAREYMVSTVWGTGSRRFDNPFQLAPQAAPLPSDDASQFALNAINFSHQAACQRFLDWLPQHKRGGLTWPLRSLNDNERSLFVVIGQAALYQYWVHANSLALRPETVPATNGASLKDPLQVVQRFNALLNDLILAQNETIPERPETFAKVRDIARSLIDLTERYLDSALVPRNRFGKTKLRLPTP